MKKTLFWSLGAVGLAGLIAGCEPELAQQPVGSEEAQWQSVIKESYPGWRPPRVAPPAIKDRYDKSVYEADARKKAEEELNAAAETEAAGGAEVAVPAAESDLTADSSDVAVKDAVKPESDVATTKDAAEKPVESQTPAEAESGANTAAGSTAEVKTGTKEPITYTVVPGDTLSGIAKKFYKDGNKYPKIIKANEETLRGNPNRIRAGMRLFIPQE